MSRYHLRKGVFFEREGDYVVVSWSPNPGTEAARILCKVPVHEWASVVAFTSARGENGTTYQEAIALLEHPE